MPFWHVWRASLSNVSSRNMDDTITVSQIIWIVYEQMWKTKYLNLCKLRQDLRLVRSKGLQYQISAMFICRDITIHYHYWEKNIFVKDNAYPISTYNTQHIQFILKAVLLHNNNDLHASVNKYYWSKEWHF